MRKFKANIYVARRPTRSARRSGRRGRQTLVNPGAKMVGKVHEALQGA